MNNLQDAMSSFCFSPSVYHKELLKNIKPELAFGARSGADAAAHQVLVRKKFAELICCDPSNRPAEVARQTVAKKRCAYGTIEKIVYRSCDARDVPALLCLPDKPPSDTVFICLQGHNGDGMHISISADPQDWNIEKPAAGDRDFALGCMKRGIAAFCIEQSCFGERRETEQQDRAPSFCHDAFVQALMLGKTLMGERVYDVARGIDFLRSRAETAHSKIGIMGNSGGGTVAVYSAALLPEIDFCMPSCSFGSYSGSKMSVYQCVCGYIPGILKYMEMDDVMACFAPKPLVIVVGKDDPILPLASVTESFGRLKKVYEEMNAGGRCHLVIGDGGHRFYAEEAWRAMLPEIRRK